MLNFSLKVTTIVTPTILLTNIQQLPLGRSNTRKFAHNMMIDEGNLWVFGANVCVQLGLGDAQHRNQRGQTIEM